MQSLKHIFSAVFLLVFSFVLASSTLGQYESGRNAAAELRPFDFTDDYYLKNGVDPKLIVDRRTGFDANSVVDFIDSEIHRNVRIIGTYPTCDPKGNIMYYAGLGEIAKSAFTKDENGERALSLAHQYPVYAFPSMTAKHKSRQANVSEIEDDYFKQNPLGVSVIVDVEFTSKAFTKDGAREVAGILGRNGVSLDRTYLILKVEEIDLLTWKGLVTQSLRGADGTKPGYMLKQVIENPQRGALSPDAFLMMVLNQHQRPLDGEMEFVDQFECLQQRGTWCR